MDEGFAVRGEQTCTWQILPVLTLQHGFFIYTTIVHFLFCSVTGRKKAVTVWK
jgi:hypothetical protein